MQSISEIQATPVEIDGILYGFPSLYCDMGHAEQVIDGLTEGFWIQFIKASHHPFKFQDDGHWHEDRRRFDHHASRMWILLCCMRATVATPCLDFADLLATELLLDGS